MQLTVTLNKEQYGTLEQIARDKRDGVGRVLSDLVADILDQKKPKRVYYQEGFEREA